MGGKNVVSAFRILKYFTKKSVKDYGLRRGSRMVWTYGFKEHTAYFESDNRGEAHKCCFRLNKELLRYGVIARICSESKIGRSIDEQIGNCEGMELPAGLVGNNTPFEFPTLLMFSLIKRTSQPGKWVND